MNLEQIGRNTRRLGVGVALAGSFSLAVAQDGNRIEKLETENSDLKKRLDALEQLAQREGLQPAKDGSKAVSAMSGVTLSGFVQASYFFNSNEPKDKKSDGYLWNTTHNSFSLNKVKITLASPAVKRSGDEWDAGYRVSMMWGEDAPVLNTGTPAGGKPPTGLESVREAFVEVNAPVGDGLNIKAGQLISLLNWESGDGGAANPNFSQGYQWYYSGNGPAAGVQVGYTFTDWLTANARVQNGLYAGPVDGNNGKAVLASLNFKPVKDLWFNLIGFNDSNMAGDTRGGSVIGGYDGTEKLHTGIEIDYFNFGKTGGKSKDLTTFGAWTWYDLTPKVTLAVRADYLEDADGGGIGAPGFRGDPTSQFASSVKATDPDGHIGSLTMTLNWKPVPRIKIQPEIRYDYTSYAGGFDGHKSRVIFGVGVNYLF